MSAIAALGGTSKNARAIDLNQLFFLNIIINCEKGQTNFVYQRQQFFTIDDYELVGIAIIRPKNYSVDNQK